MKDRGSVSNPGVELRDQIKKLATSATRDVDQVLLGIVTDTGDGESVEILLDGFAGGSVPATWGTPVTAVVDQRVTVLALKGGQSFFVVGVLPGTISAGAHTHVEADVTDLGSYSTVGHTHLEIDITDLGAYLLDITGENIGDLSDVTGSGTNRHVLVQNGSATYVGRALVEADISDLGSYSLDTHDHDSDYVELGGDTMTGALLVPSGSDSAPSIAVGFADTGFYAPGDLGATVDGNLVHAWSGTFEYSYQRHRFVDGTIALPGITYAADTDTGWHRPSADLMAAVVGGVDPFRIGKQGWTVDVTDDYLPSWQAIAPSNKTGSFTTSTWTDLDGSEKVIWDHTGTDQTVLAKAHAVCNFAETNAVGTEVRLRVGISFAGTGGSFNYGSEGQMWVGLHSDNRGSGYRAHVTAIYLGYGTATGDVVMKTQYWVGAAPDAMYGNYSIGEAYGTHT